MVLLVFKYFLNKSIDAFYMEKQPVQMDRL